MGTPTPERHAPFPETVTLLGLLVPFLLTLMYGSRTDFLEALLFALLPTLFLILGSHCAHHACAKTNRL